MKIFTNKESINFDYTKLRSPLNFIDISLYDANNNKIDINTSTYETLNNINQETIDAFISIEDKDFYNHSGINFKRIIKAGVNNLISGTIKEGASTISQQLIKNTHLSSDKTIERKIREIIITKKMEQELTKNEIMECYLNIIYFGNGSYGITEAAKNYFNKKPKELTLSESALLAGLIKAPSKYSPYNDISLAKERRDIVLKQMLNDGKIEQIEYDEAVNSELNLVMNELPDYTNTKNKFLYEKMAIQEACNILNLNIEDLKNFKIFTYKNKEISQTLQQLIENDSFYPKNSYGNTSSGMSIIIDNASGAIEALCGKSEYELDLIKRQPGSAIKPILVYSPALEEGIISPATRILDEKINIDGYSPNNVGGFHGYVSVRDSLCKSLNVPAIKILEKTGLTNSKNFAQKAGIEFNEADNNYAIALGGFTEGIDLKTLTTSFLPFSNEGNFINSTFIKEIRNQDNVIIYKHKTDPKQIMGSDTAYLMTDMLISGVKEGTSKKLNSLPFQVAGKTGTVAVSGTNYNNDAISIAYTSNKTMGVWLGNYSMEKEFQLESTNNGGTYATNLIKDMFLNLYKEKVPDDFKIPNTVKYVEIDSTCLDKNLILKANTSTPERFKVKELFSCRYLPNATSNNFKDHKLTDISIESINNKLNISFNCEEFIDYLICIFSNDEETVLDRISYFEGTFSKSYNIDNYNKNPYVYVKYKYNFDKKYNITKKYKINNFKTNSFDYDVSKGNFSSIWA